MRLPLNTVFIALFLISLTQSFSFLPGKTSRDARFLQLNLFDGVKEAFKAPSGSGSLDADRETPIDRWMGWNTKVEEKEEASGVPSDFVDAMDTANYVSTAITKPMGIIFEENDPDTGGIFLLSLAEEGAAEADGVLMPGDQLIAVNNEKVAGLSFDEALGAIVNAETEHTKLTVFRGASSQLYGPTGASKAWLDEFIAGIDQ